MPCCEDRRTAASSGANPGGAWIEFYSVGSKAITVFGPISRKSGSTGPAPAWPWIRATPVRSLAFRIFGASSGHLMAAEILVRPRGRPA
jgi:hypothetical protein